MKNSIKWSVLALQLLTVPVTYCAEEAEIYHDNSVNIGDRTNETEEERKLRDKSIELERVRHMRGESFAYSDSDPKKSPQQSTKATFEKPTNWQKISNFFGRIFGDSGVVRDSLRQHDSSTNNTNTALSEDIPSKAFLALRPDQQLEDLTEWSHREKAKFESAKANVEKTNTKALQNLETKRKELNTNIEQTNKKTSTEITNFKNNYTKLQKTFRDLPNLPENPTAKNIQDATQDLQKNNALQGSKNATITELKRTLSNSARTITTNTSRIDEDRQNLALEGIDLQKENLDNHINTQNEFNARVRKFQSEIQTILDRNPNNKLQLKYNVDTGQFEYHTASSGEATPLNKSFDAENHAQGLLRDQMTRPRSASVVTNRDEDDVPSQVFRPDNRTDTEPRREPARTGTQQHQPIDTGLPSAVHHNEAPVVAHAPEYKYLNANGDIDMSKLPSAHERYQVIDEYLAAHPEQRTALLAIKKIFTNPTPEQYRNVIDRGPHLAGLRAFINENPENIKDVIISVEHDDQDEKDFQGRFQHMNPRAEEAQPQKETDTDYANLSVHTHMPAYTPFKPYEAPLPEAQPSRYEYLDANGNIDMSKLPDLDRYRVVDEYLAAHPDIKDDLEREFRNRLSVDPAEYKTFINESDTMRGLRKFIEEPRNLKALKVALENESDFMKSHMESNT